MAIISKTCDLLLGPPSHLINLMLRVAGRIAAGEWRGLVFGLGEDGARIPVQWDYSDGEFSSWGDDDDYCLGRVSTAPGSNVDDKEDEDDDGHDGNDGNDGNNGHRRERVGLTEESSRSWEVD
jgi:hypothetical protein